MTAETVAAGGGRRRQLIGAGAVLLVIGSVPLATFAVAKALGSATVWPPWGWSWWCRTAGVGLLVFAISVLSLRDQAQGDDRSPRSRALSNVAWLCATIPTCCALAVATSSIGRIEGFANFVLWLAGILVMADTLASVLQEVANRRGVSDVTLIFAGLWALLAEWSVGRI